MPIRSRILKLEEEPDDPVVMNLVAALWGQLDEMPGCPFCGRVVPRATFPWPYKHHNVYGQAHANGAATVCAGSRNVFTLKLLGLERAL
jgi:hypothetical protein